MPVTAIKPPRKSPRKSPPARATPARPDNGTVDVLTLAEAAKYLRTSESAVLEAITKQNLPARQVGKDWRILKSAIQRWLLAPQVPPNFWETQLGAFADDPDLDRFLKELDR